MSKPKKKMTKEEKLAKDRQRKKDKYEKLKNDPELYAMQKEKERKRYLLRKEKKKLCGIKDMTPRAQREQRKRWRKNTNNYMKRKKEVQRIERVILENSPPPSDPEDINMQENVERRDPLSENNKQPTLLNSKLRRIRYRHTKVVRQLKKEIEKLKGELKKKEKLLNNPENENNTLNNEDSAKKRVNALISDVQGEKIQEIKKKLLFGETLTKNIKDEYKTLNKKSKISFRDTIIKNREQMKKYRILCKVPFSTRKTLHKRRVQNVIQQKIRNFLEDDANTSLAAGKKEFLTNKGVKKQKRYLRDNLGNLHEKFCKEEFKVGYSTFCRYRPPWIVSPNTRDTCGCKLHSNVDLLIAALKKVGITKEGSSSDILKSLCCNTSDENCLDRKCIRCANKVLDYQEFSNGDKITYHQWLTEMQSYKGRDGQQKQTRVTIKKKLEDYPRNIIQNFEESILQKFMIHAKNIVMQYESIKELKKNLKCDEVLIHIDFSENYSLKYNSEIQSFHFGGSRGQVSLHTGVLYYLDDGKKLATRSFCTVSKCLQHDAASVWAHLIPVLNMAKDRVPALKSIHFLSDSPTSQYRNKFIFYMMTRLNEHVPDVETITWNYQEAGHGKGAPDGIGAVIKRTADNFVKHGGDVGSFENFVEVVNQSVKNIKIDVIEEDTILQSKFPQNIPTFRGTMNVHQVIWCLSMPHSVAFRKLSCFVCRDSYIPCNHNRHLGVLSIGIDSRTTSQLNELEIVNTVPPQEIVCTEILQAVDLDIEMTSGTSESYVRNTETPDLQRVPNYGLNIDSPTINNNITNTDDAALMNEIRVQELLGDGDIAASKPTNTVGTPSIKSPNVVILSNVKYDWQNHTFHTKKSRVFHQNGQEEFKKFISDTSVTELGNIENINILKAENYNNEDINVNTDKINVKKRQDTEIDDNKENRCTSTTELDNIESINSLKKGNNNSENTNVDNVNINQIKTKNENDTEKDNDNLNKLPERQTYNIDDWVIVQYQIKSKIYAYIGKITECSDGSCTVLFLKKTSTRSNTFTWPTIIDEDTVAESRIMYTLVNPAINRRGQYYFDNLPNLNFK